MRLDKYLSEAGVLTRSESARAVRSGKIAVNGETVKSPSVHIDENTAVVYCCGKRVVWKRFVYIMLNKPAGYVSSTDDRENTVMELLPESSLRMGMFPCGRLDKDTTGLLLVTNDGPLAHELLSPSKHIEKTYAFETVDAVTDEMIKALNEGVDIGHHVSRSEKVILTGKNTGEITVTEGKFHQIKRMFHGVGTEILKLERISFGPLVLDRNLSPGEWRYLSEEEEKALLRAGGRDTDK